MKDNTVWPDGSTGPKQIAVCPDCGNRLSLSECPGTSAPVNVPVLPASLVEEAASALDQLETLVSDLLTGELLDEAKVDRLAEGWGKIAPAATLTRLRSALEGGS